MAFNPQFLTTQNGSVPYLDSKAVCERLIATVDIPAWPQLPRRTFRENMYVQYSPTLPGIVLDERHEKVTFDTQVDLTPGLEDFYTRYLAEDVDSFGLQPEYAAGFYTMLDALRRAPGDWAKGQVTGPISFGLTVTDQNLCAGLYNEMLADAIVKNMAMNARWQIRQLHTACPNVIIFVDEPYLASFGSAYISLSREQVTGMLDEVFESIHAEGALAGVHCCGNTDWSMLLSTQVDILNLDAFSYLDSLSLYAADLRAFLDRGGSVAWGIVPNTAEVFSVDAPGLVKRLRAGLDLISQKARVRGVSIRPEEFSSRSLITPSCGLGPATIEVAERAQDLLQRTSELLKKG